MTIKKLDTLNSYAIIAMGLLQFVGTPVFFKTAEEPAFWFFNGGITLLLLGMFNILRITHGTEIPAIRKFCQFANIIVSIFWAAMTYFLLYKFIRYPFALLPLLTIGFALLLSLKRNLPSRYPVAK